MHCRVPPIPPQQAMVMEVDVRWCGEANITLAIELSAGEFTKMCPRVTDISFVGSLRIRLEPLLDTLPGIGGCEQHVLKYLGQYDVG